MIICVTGQSGVGKTTILNLLSKKYYVEFLDNLIHTEYKVNNQGYNLIKEHFGIKYVDSNKVNRKKLGQLVFSDKHLLNKLNNILEPLIIKIILNIKKKYKNSLVLVEGGAILNNFEKYANLFDKFILIKAPKKFIKENNNIKFAHIDNDIYKYLKVNISNSFFDLIILNNKSPELCAKKIEIFLNKLKK